MKNIYLLIIIFILSFNQLQAKKYKSISEEFWVSSGYEYSLLKSFYIDYSLEQRFELNNNKEKSIYNEVKPSYKINKDLTIDVGIRLRTKAINTNLEYLSSLTYKFSIKNFDFSTRLRYHFKFENDNSSKQYIRAKFTLKHEIVNNLVLQANSEFFYHYFYDAGDRFDKSRSGIELEYEFAKNWEIAPFWLYEHEFNTNKPNDTRIYGLSLSVKFK